MTLHEFAPRRIAALLCALAMAASLTPARVFAEPVPQEESGYTAPAEGPAAAETQPAATEPAAAANPAGPGAEEPAAEETTPAAADPDSGEGAALPPEDGETAPDTAAVTPAAPEEATPADGGEGAPDADAAEKSTPYTAMKPALLAAKGAGEAPDPSEPATHAGDEEFSAYTVDGISPSGTTIDLFNYDKGQINSSHVLQFEAGLTASPDSPLDETTVNAWTGEKQPPRTGIVANTLTNGYPTLSGGANGTSFAKESLAYLFDRNLAAGKTVYSDVRGLLQVDNDGYFYYDCTQNFASFDQDSNSFTLYQKGAVHAGGTSEGWQFFPFDTAEEVFTVDNSGNLNQTEVMSNDPSIDHGFGLHMSTRFVQQYGGHVSNEAGAKEVTYNFSGDDDVWVFIDGVLVGDLGGIHDTTSLEINFATGAVVVYQDAGTRNNAYDSGEKIFEQSTLKAKFDAASVSTTDFDSSSNTFADDTTHTLDFFFMERGGTDSNMRLKYNLVNIPTSGIIKQDQNGAPLANINFNLFKADPDYNNDMDDPYYQGTTDENGVVTFTKQAVGDPSQSVPVTMGELHRQSDHWVLVEDPETAGDTYRLPGPIRLYFYKDTNLLLSANAWETGTYAQPHVTVQADEIQNNAQTMFAVVMKKVNDQWLPVSGDPWDGWHLGEDSSNKSIWEAAKANETFFEVDTSGAYALTIDDLPGDVTKYEYILQQMSGTATDAQYKVVYYTTGASKEDPTLGTHTITAVGDASQFTRTFSVTLAIANIELPAPTLLKTNEGNDPLENVTFALYKTDADFDKEGATSIRNLTTDSNGSMTVSDKEKSSTISKGYYVLEEISVPEPYILESTPIQIVVNDDGIFVYAGTATDNVTVETGIHALANSMKGFAADDDVDATLHDVQAKPQTGAWDAASQTFTWTDTSANALHLNYAPTAAGSGLIYQPTASIPGNAGTYTATEGWSRLNITQCRDHNRTQNKQDLGDKSLNALFTGSTVIHVVNSKPATPTPSATPPETTPTPQPTPAPTPTPVSQPTPQSTAAPAAVSAIPQTGDEMPVGALTALAAAAAAALAVLLVVRKRRHGKD